MSTKRLGTAIAFILLALPAQAIGQDDARSEVRQTILDGYTHTRENLTEPADTYASEGSLEFWSSGGLIQRIPADSPLAEYESYNLVPKYIWVIMLADDVAVAQFYAEGSYQAKGGPLVPNYMTRATQVLVKEDGKWKVRAAHFSPIRGGAGTEVNAVQN